MEQLHFDDHDLLRFGRARKFDLAKMQLMFTNFMNWRRDQEVDPVETVHLTDNILMLDTLLLCAISLFLRLLNVNF